MTGHEGEAEFSEALRLALRDTERFDFLTESRLRAARARAVAAAHVAPGRGWLLPAFVSALLAVVAISAVWLLRPAASSESGGLVQAEALDVLTDDLGPEFYQDLDMYRWLSQPADDTGAGGGSHV